MSEDDETIEDIVREMRQVGPYPIYRKPIFTDKIAVSRPYAMRFMYGHYVRDYGTVHLENPKIKEVSNYDLASRIELAWRREKDRIAKAMKPRRNCDTVSDFNDAKRKFRDLNAKGRHNYCRRLCHWLLSHVGEEVKA